MSVEQMVRELLLLAESDHNAAAVIARLAHAESFAHLLHDRHQHSRRR